jgi:hypothetical protein
LELAVRLLYRVQGRFEDVYSGGNAPLVDRRSWLAGEALFGALDHRQERVRRALERADDQARATVSPLDLAETLHHRHRLARPVVRSL